MIKLFWMYYLTIKLNDRDKTPQEQSYGVLLFKECRFYLDLIALSKSFYKRFERAFFSAVSFPLRRLGRLCEAFPFARRSSRGLLGDTVTEFILTHTAVECVCRHIHSPHKITTCDILRLPFPIELPEPCPVGGERFPSRVLALCLSDLDALTLSLLELLTLQLREGSKHGQHKFARRRVGVNLLLVADEGNALIGERVDDVQQVLCGAPQTADALHIESISLTHIVKHCPEP